MTSRRLRVALTVGLVTLAAYGLIAYIVLPVAWTHYEHQKKLAGLTMVTHTAQGIPGDAINVSRFEKAANTRPLVGVDLDFQPHHPGHRGEQFHVESLVSSSLRKLVGWKSLVAEKLERLCQQKHGDEEHKTQQSPFASGCGSFFSSRSNRFLSSYPDLAFWLIRGSKKP